MQKLYCYVDETGQDTKGKFFLVTVVILKKEQEIIKEKLEEIEKKSRKGIRKWFHTGQKRRENYLQQIIQSNLFKESIFYSKYENNAYMDLTVLTTAKAILQKAKKPYQATILVDGLKKSERYGFSAGLRKLKIHVRKVRGVKDESEPLIRLADAMAGFLRDYLEGQNYVKKLYQEAIRKNIIEEV